MLLIHLKCCTTITTINFRIFYYPQKKLPSLPFTPTFPRFLHSPTPESEVAQSCLTLCNPMDCSLPGSSVHGIFQAIILEWVPGCYFLLQGIFLSQGLNPGLLHCRQTFYHLSYQGYILYMCYQYCSRSFYSFIFTYKVLPFIKTTIKSNNKKMETRDF